MKIPEVGSKWVAKVDNPVWRDVDKGDVVTFVGVELCGYLLYYAHHLDVCYEDPALWHQHFEPYQEDKREFQVGDKVKCLRPNIVCSSFEGEVGEIIRIKLDKEFNQTVEIFYGDCTQVAYPEVDGVVLVEPAQEKTERSEVECNEKTPTESTAGVEYSDRLLRAVNQLDGGYTPKGIEELFESVSGDNVNSPSHYGQGNIEAIEYIKDFLTKEEYIGYLRGNIAKYLHRWRYKNGVEDLEKARVYLGWLIEELQ